MKPPFTAMLYVLICIGCFSFLRNIPPPPTYAIQREPEYRNVPGASEQQDERDQQYNSQIYQMERHLEYTDTRLNDLSDKISTMQGLGAGAMAVLGLLQLLGIFAAKQRKP